MSIRSQSEYRDSLLQKDLLEAYANGTVQTLENLEAVWYQDPRSGDCYRVKLKVEVVPDEKALAKAAAGKDFSEDPTAPLQVKVWTDKPEYRQGEQMRVYLRGNKPFYGRVVYRDASGQLVQILPNPHRRDYYFQGGVTYELPGGGDRFDLKVQRPFGAEAVVVYASTGELGAIDLDPAGDVYAVRTRGVDVGTRSRGVAVTPKQEGSAASAAAEFSETSVEVATRE